MTITERLRWIAGAEPAHARDIMEAVARIAELEGAWAEIDVALCNAERSAVEHVEEMPRLFYGRLRDRLRKVFLEQRK